MMIATAKAAFGRRWWLHLDTGTGKGFIIAERGWGGNVRRTIEFDSMSDARAYFDRYTTPIVEQTVQ